MANKKINVINTPIGEFDLQAKETVGTLTITGAATGTFNGSENKTINIPTIAGPKGDKGDTGSVAGTKVGTGTGNVVTSISLDSVTKELKYNKEFEAAEKKDLDNYILKTEKGKANGIATLNESGKIPTSQIPGSINEYEEYDNQAAFPQTGVEDRVYLAKDTNKSYRWTGSGYHVIGSDLALGETSETAYSGLKGKQNRDEIETLKTESIKYTSRTASNTGDLLYKDKNIYPNILKDNIPNNSIDNNKLDNTVIQSINNKVETTVYNNEQSEQNSRIDTLEHRPVGDKASIDNSTLAFDPSLDPSISTSDVQKMIDDAIAAGGKYRHYINLQDTSKDNESFDIVITNNRKEPITKEQFNSGLKIEIDNIKPFSRKCLYESTIITTALPARIQLYALLDDNFYGTHNIQIQAFAIRSTQDAPLVYSKIGLITANITYPELFSNANWNFNDNVIEL